MNNPSSDDRLPKYCDLPEAPGGTRSGWHVFGSDDQVGLINLQSDTRVLEAAGNIQTGQRFNLSAELHAVHPPMFSRSAPEHAVIDIGTGCDFDDVYNNYNPQVSSQWDSLAHAGFRADEFYNGATATEVRGGSRNTIEHWARRGIAGRGVLIDVAALYSSGGHDYSPGDSCGITVDDLEAARNAAGISWAPGDMMLLHTGFLVWYLGQSEVVRRSYATDDDAALTCAGLERSAGMLEYLWDSRISAVASDNPSVELLPADMSDEAWPYGFLHRCLIGQLGMALGELWWLDDLTQACRSDGRYACFVASAPLNTPGGISSPPNALAIR